MTGIGELWSAGVVLAAAFVIGWGAEAAQTFLPRALALSVLAWLQTLPEFAVEATIAWDQQRDLMIANLTGSLRLLVGLGWPMVFFVHFFSERRAGRPLPRRVRLSDEDALSILFLFGAILYFGLILLKGNLSCADSVVLIALYAAYLYLSLRLPVTETEELKDLPWVARKVAILPPAPRVFGVFALFALGGVGLYFSAHPFVDTLKELALRWGIPSFVFVQWIAPFLSEFPEKVTAFNWARQSRKAPLAIMNMVSSNLNQWTLLAAMIPVVFNLSLGHFEPVHLEGLHRAELLCTLAQSLVGALCLLNLELGVWEALLIFILWAAQFAVSSLREGVTVIYLLWAAIEIVRLVGRRVRMGARPRALDAVRDIFGRPS